MTVTKLTKYCRHAQSECDSCMYTVSQKTSHLWLAITLMHVNGFDIFGRNVTNKAGSQKTLYYASSNNSCFCTTCQNGET